VFEIPEPALAAPAPLPRERNGIVLFGALSERKGLHYLVDALEHDGQGVRLVVAGLPDRAFTLALDSLVERLRRAGVETELRDWRHSEAEFLEVLAAARAAVLPYVGHIGMSRVLFEAASVGTPVIAHADGVVGYLVTRRGLGIAVDCRDPGAFATAVRSFVDDASAPSRYAESLRRFSADHSDERFAAAVGKPFAVGRENRPSNWRIRPVRGS
jgi:glycosyltransferase involved in cell wall biosynthesis